MSSNPAPAVERRLAAILAADVVGYSRLMERDEAGTVARFKALRRGLIDPILASHGGRIVDLKGDGAMVEFNSVVAAVEAAVAIQRSMVEHEAGWPDDERIRFRIGITSGDVIVQGEEIFGQHMNVAARIQALCEPGGIWVSGPVHHQIAGKLSLDCEPMGVHQVKNIGAPIEAWRVRLPANSGTPPAKRLPANSGTPPVKRRTMGGFSRRLQMVVAAAIVLLLATGAWYGLAPTPASAGKPSIAVLPFDNLSGDAEQGFLADGFAEDLITELARNGELRVMARNTSFSFRGQAKRIEDVARELNVSYVLEDPSAASVTTCG